MPTTSLVPTMHIVCTNLHRVYRALEWVARWRGSRPVFGERAYGSQFKAVPWCSRCVQGEGYGGNGESRLTGEAVGDQGCRRGRQMRLDLIGGAGRTTWAAGGPAEDGRGAAVRPRAGRGQ